MKKTTKKKKKEEKQNRTAMEPDRLEKQCFHAVRKHFAVLGTEAVLDLPTPLIKDLLPHLTVCQLDEVQPALNRRGLSTYSGWFEILQDLVGPSRALDFRTEEEAKHEVMLRLFTSVFYRLRNSYVLKNSIHLNTNSFLTAAAKSVHHFILIPCIHQALQALTWDQQPLLALLEKHIRSVHVNHFLSLTENKTQGALYVLHRLLDHGVTTNLVVSIDCPLALAWLLHGRGSQYVNLELKKLMCWGSQTLSPSEDAVRCSPGDESTPSDNLSDHVSPCKRAKLYSESLEEEEDKSGVSSVAVDPHVLCHTFNPCAGPSAGTCTFGQITHLEIRTCGPDSLNGLGFTLPTFFCLQSLTLHSKSIFRESDVLDFAGALKQLSDSSCSSLVHLNIGLLPHIGLMKTLLNASPRLTSLYVEFQTVMWGPQFNLDHLGTAEPDISELPLEKLTVKVTQLQTDPHFLTSVLRRCPYLTSLHIAGMRLPTGSSQSHLLSTLSESNRCLKALNLEDIKLCDCLPDILKLLRGCMLEELYFIDCRLLERCINPKKSLLELVAVLKIPSLHTLSLAQNRLARNVCVLAELFSGSSQSSLKQLDIKSNFIRPADLLEFAERLRDLQPPHRLTLDLRKNPGDRDPDIWNTALQTLQPFSLVLVEGWKSNDTMVDHISNM
ncbi:leucine-rich repeat-containing protein 41 isoform X2 [Girardinichthys multiradiatus]|uniref:leucine-rich repeat-containing protein 41 isoform X2 n=1 Tax=Girardinichthys multiradiatus TaxID=208333 RepID=UPI001FAE2DE8|nr:leucine-rich repeat-containing protein 41 isoform X2 [Girardinichthys multiradiatus]